MIENARTNTYHVDSQGYGSNPSERWTDDMRAFLIGLDTTDTHMEDGHHG